MSRLAFTEPQGADMMSIDPTLFTTTVYRVTITDRGK
jgi:hypothetical protein